MRFEPTLRVPTALLDSMVDLLITLNPDGKIYSLNKGAVKLLEYQEFELEGRSIDELVDTSQQDILKTAFTDVRRHTEVSNRTVSLISKYNQWVQLEFAMFVSRDNEQSLEKLVFIGKVCGHRNNLLLMTNYLDTILLNLPVGLAIMEGPEFRYFRINKVLAQLNGLPIENHMGRRLADVLPHAKESIIPELEMIRQTQKSILGREFSICLPQNPDKQFHLIDYLFPIVSEGGKTLAVGAVVLDITKRKQAEIALADTRERLENAEKWASIGEMSAGLAHEINQPLAAINMHVEMLSTMLALENVTAQQDVAKSLNKLTDQIKRIDQIISHLKVLSREEAEFQCEENDINVIIKDSFVLLNSSIKQANIKVNTSLAKDLPPLFCNFVKLSQVFTNILNNAIDAVQDSESKEITVRSYLEPGNVCIDVTDTGCGISQVNSGKVFDPFFTTKKVGEGTGLGLSISYGIVAEHNGVIKVTSLPEGGACFSVQLPVLVGKRDQENDENSVN